MDRELEKYYLNLIEMVNEMRLEEKFDEALEIIGEELQAPYIPIEFETRLTELLAEITFQNESEHEGNKFMEMTKEELRTAVCNYNEGSIYAILIFFERFREDFSERDLDLFKMILSLDKISNDLKIVILEQMNLNKIDGIYEYYSNSQKKTFEIDVSKQKFINDEFIFKEAFSRLSELYYDEPIAADLSNNLIFATYNHFFPDFSPIESEKTLIISIVQSLGLILTGKNDGKQTKLSKVIMKIMEKQGEK